MHGHMNVEKNVKSSRLVKHSARFLEPESSLPISQDPADGHYSQPDQSKY